MLTDNVYNTFSSHLPRILVITSICATLVFGFFCGSFYANMKEVPSYPIQFIDDINPYVPYLKILGLENNQLQIETKDHSIRIENGEDILNAPANTPFTVPIANILASSDSPAALPASSCAYAAAKTGKYLYSAESTQAQRLSASKRCFASIAEGEKAGLVLWEKK
ncbi:MAG: hypothetical protein ACK4NC_03220 [Candidatus Gracilibacteria bacterium]